MLVFIDAKIAFFSTPKTGSTAYHAILRRKADIAFSGKPSCKHMSVRKYEQFMAPYLKKAHGIQPERVAVFRDPLAQIGSWFRYRQRIESANNKRSTVNVTFDEFVLAYISPNRPQFAKIGSQFKFVTDAKGELRVQHLFAYESPDLLRTFLGKKLGFDCSTEQMNVSPEGETTLSIDTENKFREALANDFALHDRIMKAGGHLVTKLEAKHRAGKSRE
jgi:hypothetical protein